MPAEQDKEFGDFLSFLRWLPGSWSQARLGEEAGIGRSEINRYEKGKTRPRPATLHLITTAVGVPERLVGFLRWCHTLIRKSIAAGKALDPPAGESAEETRSAVWHIVERSLALARAEHALVFKGPRRPGQPTEEDHRRVEALFKKLTSYPEAKQRLLIQAASSYQDPLLCLRFCKESETLAADDSVEAAKFAERALFIAQHVQGSGAFRSRCEGWATGFIGNVQRSVGSDLPGAERTFARAWRLWRQGEDPAGLFSEAYLLDMEASLRRDQRIFPKARKLHDDALVLARPDEVGSILLNKACTFQAQGEHEEALQALERAAQVVDGNRQPRLRFGVQFNRAANLLELGRAKEAAPLVREVRELGGALGHDIDLVRLLWLEGKCAAGLGQRAEAVTSLEQVRRAFAERNLPFDFAQASLDLALLYRGEERFTEIKVLAGEMLTIFQAQQVAREALGAVALFQEAAEQDRVTAGLVRRLQDFLAKARSDPKLRFKE
jgi:transcriptional regulator with XRE-family HTH domain